MSKAIIKILCDGVTVAYRKDAENRYSLLEDWRIPKIARHAKMYPLPNFENAYFRFENGNTITVKAYESTSENNVCDGASFAPDSPSGVIAGAMFHDPWYLSCEAITAAYNDQYPRKKTTVADVRKYGDIIMHNIIKKAGGCSIVANIYYYAVRIFGGLYTNIKKLFVIAIAISLCIGFCGCGAPNWFDDDDAFQHPIILKVVSK